VTNFDEVNPRNRRFSGGRNKKVAVRGEKRQKGFRGLRKEAKTFLRRARKGALSSGMSEGKNLKGGNREKEDLVRCGKGLCAGCQRGGKRKKGGRRPQERKLGPYKKKDSKKVG